MKETAEIICRKEPCGVFCEWEGNPRGVATVFGNIVFEQIPKGESPIGKIIRLGGLKLRIIEQKHTEAMYWDAFWVMPAINPHSELLVLYRSAVRGLLRAVLNLETRIRGFMLQGINGRVMPFTSWLYERLL